MISIKHFRYSALLGVLLLAGLSCGGTKDGGVFRSLDGGETWEQKVFVGQVGKNVTTISDAQITAMAFKPGNANIIYLGTKTDGLYITLAGGEQWVQSSITSGTVSSISVDPIQPANVYMAKDASVLKSTDEGVTWQTVYTDVQSATITNVLVDSFDDSRLYATTSAGSVLKSVDFGINWDIRFQNDSSVKRIAMANYDTRVLYILLSNGVIYTTSSGGESVAGDTADAINSGWAKLLPKDFSDDYKNGEKAFDLSLDRNDAHTIYMATERGMMRSHDAGVTWEDVITLLGVDNDTNKTMTNITVAPGNPAEIFFTVGNDLHKSTDGGNTWKVIEHFPSQRNLARLLIDFQTPNVIYIGTQTVQKKGGLLNTK